MSAGRFAAHVECPKCHTHHTRLWCDNCSGGMPPSALVYARCPNCGGQITYYRFTAAMNVAIEESRVSS